MKASCVPVSGTKSLQEFIKINKIGRPNSRKLLVDLAGLDATERKNVLDLLTNNNYMGNTETLEELLEELL